MAQRLGLGRYQLTPTEGLHIAIGVVGALFVASAALDTTVLPMPAGGGVIDITPQMMTGSGSKHRIEIEVFFNGAAPNAHYTIRVRDDSGAVLDTFDVFDSGSHVGEVVLKATVV
jgi:hypothetical protein